MNIEELLQDEKLVPNMATLLTMATNSDTFLMMPEERRSKMLKNYIICMIAIDRAQGGKAPLTLGL